MLSNKGPREPQKHAFKSKEKREITPEMLELLHTYHERINNFEEVTIIELYDPRELVEVIKKEIGKKDMLTEMDLEDMPKQEEIEDLMKAFEMQERRGEIAEKKEEQFPSEPIGLAPMDEEYQILQKRSEELTEEEIQRRRIMKLEEGIVYEFPLKTIVTTSSPVKKTQFDIRYVKVHFIFNGNVVLEVKLSTDLVARNKIFTIVDYCMRIWNNNMQQYEELQDDLARTRKYQTYANYEIVSNSTQKVKIYNLISSKKVFFNVCLENTIYKKKFENDNEELIEQYKSLLQESEIFTDRAEIIPRLAFEGNWKGYKTSERPLFIYIQKSGANTIRANGNPYTTVQEYIEDFAKQMKTTTIENVFQELKESFKNSDLKPNEKIEAINLVDKYILEMQEDIIKDMDEKIMRNKEDQIFSRYKKALFAIEKQGNKSTSNTTKLILDVKVEDTKVIIKIKCEDLEQQERLEELFKKELKAIILRTEEFPRTPLVERRKQEYEKWLEMRDK